MSFLTVARATSDGPSSGGAKPSVGPDPSVPSPDDITPELALVSSEIAEAARRRLPDRPWEAAFAWRRRSSPGARRAAPQASAARTPTARAPAEVDGVTGRSAKRQHVVAGLVMAVALGIAVVLTGIFEPGPGDPVLTTTIRSVDNAAGDGQRIASTLLPSAGYVVSPDGRFLTDRAGDIEWFILPLRCGGDQLEVRNVSVLRGSLRFTGRASDQAVRVELRGRLLDREHVRGIVAAHDPSCSPRRVRFSARVS